MEEETKKFVVIEDKKCNSGDHVAMLMKLKPESNDAKFVVTMGFNGDHKNPAWHWGRYYMSISEAAKQFQKYMKIAGGEEL